MTIYCVSLESFCADMQSDELQIFGTTSSRERVRRLMISAIGKIEILECVHFISSCVNFISFVCCVQLFNSNNSLFRGFHNNVRAGCSAGARVGGDGSASGSLFSIK